MCYIVFTQHGDRIRVVENHTKQINDIQTSRDSTMVITASKDFTAKVCVQAL